MNLMPAMASSQEVVKNTASISPSLALDLPLYQVVLVFKCVQVFKQADICMPSSASGLTKDEHVKADA